MNGRSQMETTQHQRNIHPSNKNPLQLKTTKAPFLKHPVHPRAPPLCQTIHTQRIDSSGKLGSPLQSRPQHPGSLVVSPESSSDCESGESLRTRVVVCCCEMVCDRKKVDWGWSVVGIVSVCFFGCGFVAGKGFVILWVI